MPVSRAMGVYRFEDLRVWQAAKRQCDCVGALMTRPEFRRDWELTGQMNAAALSVMFNITEGFLRRQDGETLQFLRYSFASNGELKAGYYAAEARQYLVAAEIGELIDLNDSIAKMLRRWQATLRTQKPRPKASEGHQPAHQHEGPRTKDQGPRTRLRPHARRSSPRRPRRATGSRP
jgi:four helix bundle protein